MSEQRFIDAGALKAYLCVNTSIGFYNDCTDGSEVCFTSREVDKAIDAAPTIDPESLRPHGRWVDVKTGYIRSRDFKEKCSICGFVRSSDCGDADFKYCPNCGAKMED